jgi:hypothetical protein
LIDEILVVGDFERAKYETRARSFDEGMAPQGGEDLVPAHALRDGESMEP